MIITEEMVCPNCLNEFEVVTEHEIEECVCPFCKRMIRKADNEFDE